jgi:nicotinate dehydrogenase subunit B
MTMELPQSLAANPRLSTWLTVRPDGFFDLRVGKVELGQGIVTALTQIATQELGVVPGSVRPIATNTQHSPNEGITAGSLSVTFSGAAVRRACAEVRLHFHRAAALRAGLPITDVTLVDGRFVGPGGMPAIAYADLVDEVDLHVEAGDPSLEVSFLQVPPGASMDRVDLPDKIFGRPRFIHDLAFDGMLHARVVRPPRMGAHLLDAPIHAVEALPGVRHVLREQDFLAVVADREGQADQAAKALAAGATWSAGVELPDRSDLPKWLRDQPVETTTIRSDGAEHADGWAHRATYFKPFVAHGSIAPSCGIAVFRDGLLQIWSHSQGVFTLGSSTAAALGLAPESVVVQHVEGAGSYGHNSADDAAFDAALIATLVPGPHIRVQWSRADELGWEPFGPAMVGDVTATLTPEGRISDWSYELWSNGHTARPGYAPRYGLLADAHRSGVADIPASIDPPAARGLGGARNAEPYYDLPRADITAHRLLTMPIRSSALRSLGAHLNIFALESFMDELAASAGRDPLEFRLDHLSDPRACRVLTTAAGAAGWGEPTPEGHGRGLAFSRYKNRGSYCAIVADVEATETVRVTRLTIAIDVGRVVNEDGARNQIEGGAIQATSWSLLEQVGFDRQQITSTDWESYPMLGFSDVPLIDVHLISRPDEPTLGAGEATQGPVPAAIGNAIFDAIGVRVRTLPFTAQNVVAAIDES